MRTDNQLDTYYPHQNNLTIKSRELKKEMKTRAKKMQVQCCLKLNSEIICDQFQSHATILYFFYKKHNGIYTLIMGLLQYRNYPSLYSTVQYKVVLRYISVLTLYVRMQIYQNESKSKNLWKCHFISIDVLCTYVHSL